MDEATLIRALVAACCATIEEHSGELTKLDQAIGDGDHGLNMSRGFKAITAEADALAAMSLGDALKKAGMTLVMKVGGASGPLYGSLLMDMGKAASTAPANEADVAQLLRAGIDAVKKRGKSDVGAKTMLDVLVPVAETVAEGGNVDAIRARADEALEATRDMLATKGRAAFLGERSIGHIDPGARSSALLIHAVCNVLEAS
ncbi:dihydroxyacetone kinase subunit DhaL [Rhodobium gokarnense]|uniref:Dihydroxyacetone kinase-like protein n=1 Tax=Rhodobium gokarnense TaxID=364296 RepID=A0ABT3HFZ1_9HYPH|nr:dihydroxyacetone kinase subunit DhaL [Rhodobium gokarnense]MCW2309269.1 dihydroxyacetone kinase-like protein [Rhodobium gokarnense]